MSLNGFVKRHQIYITELYVRSQINNFTVPHYLDGHLVSKLFRNSTRHLQQSEAEEGIKESVFLLCWYKHKDNGESNNTFCIYSLRK